MEQPQNSAEVMSDRSKRIGSGLGIASFAIGIFWVIVLLPDISGLYWVTEWIDLRLFVIMGFVGSIVGLAIGIAGIVQTRLRITFSIIGIVANSMVFGFLVCAISWFYLLA